MRGGRRRAGRTIVAHVLRTEEARPARFGFVVSKAVGGAVQRNLVKRRLRAAAAEQLRGGASGFDAVVRALPASSTAGYRTLRQELVDALGGAG